MPWMRPSRFQLFVTWLFLHFSEFFSPETGTDSSQVPKSFTTPTNNLYVKQIYIGTTLLKCSKWGNVMLLKCWEWVYMYSGKNTASSFLKIFHCLCSMLFLLNSNMAEVIGGGNLAPRDQEKLSWTRVHFRQWRFRCEQKNTSGWIEISIKTCSN